MFFSQPINSSSAYKRNKPYIIIVFISYNMESEISSFEEEICSEGSSAGLWHGQFCTPYQLRDAVINAHAATPTGVKQIRDQKGMGAREITVGHDKWSDGYRFTEDTAANL